VRRQKKSLSDRFTPSCGLGVWESDKTRLSTYISPPTFVKCSRTCSSVAYRTLAMCACRLHCPRVATHVESKVADVDLWGVSSERSVTW